MKPLRSRIIPAVVAIAALVGVLWILRNEPEAAWVRLEAPDRLTRGQSFSATLTLADPTDGLVLACDLHATSQVDPVMRTIAGGGAQAVVSGKHDYTFSLTVPGDPGATQAHFVIYIGPTRRWHERQRAAESRRIRFESAVRDPARATAIPVFDQVHDPGVVIPDHRLMRFLTAVVWLICAVLVICSRSSVVSRPGAAAWFWAGGFLLLALWELSLAGPRLSEWARSLAQTAHIYEDRRGFQQIVTALAVAGAGLFVAALLRSSRMRLSAMVLAGVALTVVTAIASMLSLHEVDRLLATGVVGVPAAVVLRLVGAFTAAGGLWRARVRGAERAGSAFEGNPQADR